MGSTAVKSDLPEPAKLSRRGLREISQITQDVRLTLKRLEQPGCSALAVVDGDAVDAVKDLYYVVSREDPNNVMPARKLLCEQHVVAACLLPLLGGLNADPTAGDNQKRWSVSLYHTFRVLSALCMPVAPTNAHLTPGCALDALLMGIRAELVRGAPALDAVVALLQYYVERKAEKQARFAPAEESKIEDARIENILCFFRNILAPPRADRRGELRARDRGVHLALVGALFEADLYSTIAILFSSRDEARAQLTDIVYIVADIYRYTYRLSSPTEIAAMASTESKSEPQLEAQPEPGTAGPAAGELPAPEPTKPLSVFDTPEPGAAPTEEPTASKPRPPAAGSQAAALRSRRGAGLRDAMRRERVLLGGARSVTTTARWSNRHSGGFVATVDRLAAGDGSGGGGGVGGRSSSSAGVLAAANGKLVKRVVDARGAIRATKDADAASAVRLGVQLNSELLCALSLTGAVRRPVATGKSALGHAPLRADLLERGRAALAPITAELVAVAFQFLARELHDRIELARARPGAADSADLAHARRAFLAIVATVVGVQRAGAAAPSPPPRAAAAATRLHMHRGDVEAAVAAEITPVGSAWLAVEAGIELQSFKLAFDVLVQSSVLGRKGAEDVELATFAILQMMKMLQSMALHPESEEDVEKELELAKENGAHRRSRLTGREMALNTLEDLFTIETCLNAPCSLAKDYDAKFHSFRHLAHIVELAHAFTSTLLDEKELEQLKVQRKKRKLKKKKKDDEESEEGGKNAENSKETKNEDGKNEEGNMNEGDKNEDGTGTGDGGIAIPGKSGNEKSEEPGKPMGDTSAKEVTSPEKMDIGPEKIPGISAKEGDDDVEAKTGEQNGKSVEANEHAPVKEKKGTAKGNEAEKTDDPVPIVDDNDSGAESDESDEMVTREVESIGVVRRFAHGRALQVLSLPIRACLCKAATISGAEFPVPDGAKNITSCSLAAKSFAVLSSIWSSTGKRDRGALRGHFYSFSLLQLFSVCMNASTHKAVTGNCIISRVSELGVQVTRGFHEWLSVNPGLALDCLLFVDKGVCCAYTHTLYLKNTSLNVKSAKEDGDDDGSSGEEAIMNHIDERRAILAQEDAEMRTDLIDDGELDDDLIPRERTRTPKKKGKPPQKRRERAPRAQHEEDADVDDLDALKIGATDGDDESEQEPTAMEKIDALEKALKPRNRRGRKRKPTVGDDGDLASSDSNLSDEEPRIRTKKPSKKKQKNTSPGNNGRTRKSKAKRDAEAKEAAKRSNKFYAESSDDLNEEDMRMFTHYSDDDKVGGTDSVATSTAAGNTVPPEKKAVDRQAGESQGITVSDVTPDEGQDDKNEGKDVAAEAQPDSKVLESKVAAPRKQIILSSDDDN